MIFKRSKPIPPEQRVRDAITTGQVLNVGVGSPEGDNPATGGAWGPERSIRGQLLSELLAEERNRAPSSAWFLHIRSARITGKLDLEAVTVRCSVTLEGCYFDEEVTLKEAQVIALRLPGCHLPGLAAQQIETRRNLELNRGFTANGEVNLLGANVGGRLELNEATLCNQGGPALSAEGLTVSQDMYCEGLQAYGEIRLEESQIGGLLNFYSACLHNPGGRALAADGVTVARPMYCGEGFEADGGVSLVGARISGVLDFNDATLRNPGGFALAADYLTVDHDMLCGGGFHADGIVSLRDARLGGLSDSRESWPRKLVLDGLTYGNLDPAEERLAWLRNDLDRPSPQPYEQLASFYRKAGREEDARRVAIARQRRRRRELSLPGRLWGVLLDAVVGYGYRAWQAALWLAGLVVLGHLVFSCVHHLGLLIPTREKAQPSFHSVWYALDVLLPIVNLGQESAWTPYGCAMHLANGFTLVGWLLTTVVVAGLTGVLKR